jgi:hypothetical protein
MAGEKLGARNQAQGEALEKVAAAALIPVTHLLVG